VSPLDLLGWLASALVVWSLMQARVLRFRVLNLAGAALAALVNALLGIWPFAVMNGIIAVIDVYWLRRLARERHDVEAYTVIEVGVDDAYLRRVLSVHGADMAASHPSFRMPPIGAAVDRSAFLVLRGDETVGMVIVRDAGAGVGEVEVDYVTQRFRDFTPGEFVYRSSGIFPAKGFTRLRMAEDVPGEHAYYTRVGFREVDGRWERPVEPAVS
jgi:hypothetical protein